MKSPAREVYLEERKAEGQAPAPYDPFRGESGLEAALLTDAWYVWPAILALTLAWFANVGFRWPVSGVSGMIETAAFAGLAAQQIEARRGYARSSLVYAAWAVLACLGAPNLPLDAAWLAGGLVVCTGFILTKRSPAFLLAIAAGLPWAQAAPLPWGIRLAQSFFGVAAAIAAIVVWRRSPETHVLRFWQRNALAVWIILVLPSATSVEPGPALAMSGLGLAAAGILRSRFRDRRSFLLTVLIWAGLHVLGLRTEAGMPILRLALILSGFLLLVVAGWRFAAARRHTLAPCVLLTSPLCIVPDLHRSQDYPLKIYVR